MRGIIDMHCDTLLEGSGEQQKLRDREGHLNLEKMKAAGGMAQCFAIFATQGDAPGDRGREGREESPYEQFQRMYQYYLQEMAENSDLILPALTAKDVEENWSRGKLSAILTVEDCMLLEGKPERIDELKEKGVRMACLIWNYENSLGFPNHKDPKHHGLGLKPFGIEMVERMNEIGIIVDVSHLSEGGFYDVVRHSKKPFAASHSCARALCDHSRNLSDDQLRRLGEAGGVVGINFYSTFLTEGSNKTMNSEIVRHAVHVANQAGVEAVALGSDFDGIECQLEMTDYTGFPQLIGLLEKEFTAVEMDKICSGNFLRVFGECGVVL